MLCNTMGKEMFSDLKVAAFADYIKGTIGGSCFPSCDVTNDYKKVSIVHIGETLDHFKQFD